MRRRGWIIPSAPAATTTAPAAKPPAARVPRRPPDWRVLAWTGGGLALALLLAASLVHGARRGWPFPGGGVLNMLALSAILAAWAAVIALAWRLAWRARGALDRRQTGQAAIVGLGLAGLWGAIGLGAVSASGRPAGWWWLAAPGVLGLGAARWLGDDGLRLAPNDALAGLAGMIVVGSVTTALPGAALTAAALGVARAVQGWRARQRRDV